MRLFTTVLFLGSLLFSTHTSHAVAPKFRVSVVSAEGYAGEDQAKLERAVALFEQVFNLPEFWERIEKRDIPGCYKRKAGYDRTALHNQEVLQALQAAQENGSEDQDGIAQLRLVMAPDSAHEIGHTDMGPNGKITTGASTVHEESDAGLAGHFAHEWTHTLGFGHPLLRKILPFQRNRHACTVPYAVGNLVVEIAEKLQDTL